MHVKCGMGVMNGTSKNEKKIQLEVARIATGLTKFASKDSLYFETRWETLANRRENRKLTTFYKIHNNL